MRRTCSLVATFCVLLGASTAHAQRNAPLLGSKVRFMLPDGALLAGELLAAQRDSAWLLKARVMYAVHLPSAQQVEVRGRGVDRRGIMRWALAGGVVSGGALTMACASVTSDCGLVAPTALLLWGIVGGISAALTQSPHRWVEARAELLAPYARFPQGLPPAFAP